ncbi:hypothetical protein RvY_14082 [Ramazzottius varieornatus]|uniref:Uncharacterized protein n=1 Tax=Ramazzottius varieornatus TaxID=947166 RepID=A0A1D1VQ49_RAMVA|nr:hypothetical protein RvY_14082 [Ramazzottius varieornatus]
MNLMHHVIVHQTFLGRYGIISEHGFNFTHMMVARTNGDSATSQPSVRDFHAVSIRDQFGTYARDSHAVGKA